MCVLVAWLQQIPGYPLVVAANRDERFSRPSSAPFLWSSSEKGGADPGSGSGSDNGSDNGSNSGSSAGWDGVDGTVRLVAPRDDVAGGTWWAVSESGLFVGITNRAGAAPDPTRRSRGLLVLDMAREDSLEGAERRLRELDPASHNGFHLLVATTEGALRAVSDGERIDCVRLQPGLHVISERSFGAMPISRDDVVLSVFQALPVDRLKIDDITRALGTHEDDPWRSVCVHPDLPDYGTRSSSILAFSDDPSASRLLHADGPPCTTPLDDRSELLRALFRPLVRPSSGSVP